MSELKARTARSIANEEEMLELGADSPIESAQVYLKSEADKVIANLERSIESWIGSYEASRRINARTESKLRHHKYKRCLAIAMWCRRNRLHASVCGPVEKIDFWEKWRKRWLELAEKFKPNSTLQKKD